MLDATDLAELRTLLRGELSAATGPRVTDAIQTTAEAVRYTKAVSPAAFYHWCRRWKCTPVANGRFPTRRLDAALDREQRSGAARRPGTGRRRAPAAAPVAAAA